VSPRQPTREEIAALGGKKLKSKRALRQMPPTLHMLGLFHTVPSLDYSHCAFTGKVLRFAKMMKGFLPYIEYANEGSTSEADEHIVILRDGEITKLMKRFKSNVVDAVGEARAEELLNLKPTEFVGALADVRFPHWHAFDTRLRMALKARVRPGDFILHPFGIAHRALVNDYSDCIHLETGIGYPDAPFGAYRVYESWAWAHAHWGRWGEAGLGGEWIGGVGLDRNHSWVIPNYFDIEEWPIGSREWPLPSYGVTPYALFMGRIDPAKGAEELAQIIKFWFERHGPHRLHFKIAGQGNWALYSLLLKREITAGMVEYLGPVKGAVRGPLVAGAALCLMPTRFVEPFGGSGVEGLLTGTPLVASAWGAFTETIQIGVNGYVARTYGEYLRAMENILDGKLAPRSEIAKLARGKYSLETCREKYVKVFGALLEKRHTKEGVPNLSGGTLWETG
jgi:glycosyltransferase involved in cell wall biosynthesis